MCVILGFDTSCYTTSAAAVDERGEVLASARMLLPVPQGQRGLRQSEAVFAHVRQMPQVMAQLRLGMPGGERIAAVCASARPRDGEESYMPVFSVGLGHASVLAAALNVPLYTTSHQQGHIAAGLIGNPAVEGPFVALHLSGGTTELLDCRDGTISLLGGTEDLHAGQVVDRVGVALGLPFPAGPALERLALNCGEQSEAILPLSVSRDGLHCHLSGVETQAQRLIGKGTFSPERIALEVFDVLARTVARLVDGGCRHAGVRDALVVGGVASSMLLRELVKNRLSRLRSPVRVIYGQPRYSADNAAGVARIGLRRYLSEH